MCPGVTKKWKKVAKFQTFKGNDSIVLLCWAVTVGLYVCVCACVHMLNWMSYYVCVFVCLIDSHIQTSLTHRK